MEAIEAVDTGGVLQLSPELDLKDYPMEEFNKVLAIKAMSHVRPTQELYERVIQATNFVSRLFKSKGDVNEIELFINSHVIEYFSIPKDTRNIFAKNFKDSYKEVLKARRKAQSKKEIGAMNEAKKERDIKNGVYTESEIPAEFNGLYEVKKDPLTDGEKIITCPDRIARRIVETKNVITYRDNVYTYSEEFGYFINDPKVINEEATRIDLGIMQGISSNGSINRVKNIVETVSHLNRKTSFPFTNPLKVVPVKNGVLKINFDTEEIELVERDSSKYQLNYVFPIKYDPEAPTEPVIQELSKYINNPEMIVQIGAQVIAQTLTDTPFKKGYFAHGPKNYGKTTIADELFGKRFIPTELRAGVQLNRLTGSSDNRFVTASLEGALMNIEDEMKPFDMKEADALKKVTGTFSLKVEPKGVMPYSTRSTAVHFYLGNYLPKVEDKVKKDDAFWVRVNLLNFNVTKFERDVNSASHIFTDEFMSGFFNLALKMAVQMIKTSTLPIDQDWREAREQWLIDSNPLYNYFVENMERGGTTKILKDDLLKQLQIWWDDNKDEPELRPSKYEDMNEAIKLLGGDLNSEAWFSMMKIDDNHHFVPQKDSEGKQIMDTKGRPKLVRENKLKQCYSVPLVFKENSKYRGKIRDPVPVSFDTTIDDYQN